MAPPNSGRSDVNLRTGGVLPSVVSRPIAVGTPGIGTTGPNVTEDLLRNLGIGTARLNDAAERITREERDRQFKEGQLAQEKNQKDFAKAVEDGTIPQTANPWFIKGYQNQDGRVAGLAYYGELRKAYSESPAKGSDDPKVFEEFVQGFTKSYMERLGKNQSDDWWAGYKTVADGAKSSLATEHAQEAEKAVIAKQEANTGAQVNAILNSTRDPVAAAAEINRLGADLKLKGMPSASFEKVAAEAILAKAKMGDGNMLKALDHVTTGDGKAVLASNPKVTMAKVDVSNFLTEKARGDTRWAWANDDRQWTLKQRERADAMQKREDEPSAREKDNWGKQARVESLLSKVVIDTMRDPANAFANNRERITEIAKLDASKAESATNYIDGFLTKRERVPDHIERPVLAQLESDMMRAAGNPAAMAAVVERSITLFNQGSIGRDTHMKFMDDARSWSAFDPDAQRKLQAPPIQAVRKAAEGLFTKDIAKGAVGPEALDVLYANQAMDRAMRDFLRAKPNATEQELADVATKALQGIIPSIGPAMGTGKANDLVNKVGTAGARLQQAQPQDGNTPPAPPPLPAKEAAKAVPPVDAQALIREIEAANASGGVAAVLKALSDFDNRIGIPGLGREIIELHSSPPPAPPKKGK